MNTGYENDKIWRQIQEYLPIENQINDNNKPNEEWLDFSKNIIHIDRYSKKNAKGIIIIFHGVGGNGRLLSFIALPLHKAGYEIICPDLPLYGHTICNRKITYSDWVDFGTYIAKYYQKENKPIYLFGLSAGGMLAYQVSCRLHNINGLILTCLLDQRINEVTNKTASNRLMAILGKPMLKIFYRLIGKIKIPMKAVCNMKAIVNNESLANLLMSDPISAGVNITLEFLHGMLNPKIETEAEDFNKCPILLAHPEKDYWTDISLSKLFFDKIKARKNIKILCDAGHFPIEKKGLKQLEEYCIDFLNECENSGILTEQNK